VPRLVVNPRNPSLVALPFGTRIPPRDIAIAWHRDRYRSAAAHAFAELACEMGADYVSGQSSASAASRSRRPAR
jgi:DNA-binding transcriptional LysR family regulator